MKPSGKPHGKVRDQAEESDTRERIIEAFLRLAVRIGIEKITLQKVASEAKISYFAVHYHFGGDKKGMTEFAVEYVGRKGQEYISAKTDLAAKGSAASLLEAYIRGTLDWAREHPHHGAFWIYYYYMCTCNPGIQAANRVLLIAARERVGQLIALDVDRGLYSIPEPLTEDLVNAVHTQVAGAVMVGQAEGTETAMNRQYRQAWGGIRSMLGIEEKKSRRLAASRRARRLTRD